MEREAEVLRSPGVRRRRTDAPAGVAQAPTRVQVRRGAPPNAAQTSSPVQSHARLLERNSPAIYGLRTASSCHYALVGLNSAAMPRTRQFKYVFSVNSLGGAQLREKP